MSTSPSIVADAHALTTEELAAQASTDVKTGLSNEDAQTRLQAQGRNTLPKKLQAKLEIPKEEVEVEVVRDGKTKRIPSGDVVVGDVVVIRVGDTATCDLRIISVDGLCINAAFVTGEAEPITVTDAPAPPGSNYLEATNMVFSHCVAVDGMGRGVVVATGADTLVAGVLAQVKDDKKKCAVM